MCQMIYICDPLTYICDQVIYVCDLAICVCNPVITYAYLIQFVTQWSAYVTKRWDRLLTHVPVICICDQVIYDFDPVICIYGQ